MVTYDLLLKPVTHEVDKKIRLAKAKEISDREIQYWYESEEARMLRKMDAIGTSLLAQFNSLGWL